VPIHVGRGLVIVRFRIALPRDDLTAELVDDASDFLDRGFGDTHRDEDLALRGTSNSPEWRASDGVGGDVWQPREGPSRVARRICGERRSDDNHGVILTLPSLPSRTGE